MKLQPIDWKKARYLDGGGFAAVFDLGDGTVVKVGDIDPKEKESQEIMAGRGRALPVLEYEEDAEIPSKIRKLSCPEHGPRKHIVAEGDGCLCHEQLSILRMPRAEPAVADQAFMDAVLEESLSLPNVWDARPANVARWQGKLVALDFGREFR